MLTKFNKKFQQLPQSNKAMVYLTWLYSVGIFITTMFVNIYVFKINNSVIDNIIYSAIFFTSTFAGFSAIGYIMSIVHKNIRNLYYFSYIFFILSFIVLFIFEHNIIGVYVFALMYGMGNGAFWCALHTQELKNIEDKNRDFYSSSISAGKNILEIFVPLLVAVAFILGKQFHFDGYKVLFGFLPLLYLFSFFFIKDIDSYYPKKIKKSDVKNFFDMKKYKYGHLYFLMGGFQMGFGVIIFAVANIILLKSELNIGIFQALLSIVSTYVIVHIGLKRKTENRLKYFGVLSIFLCVNTLFFAYNFNVLGLIVFSLIGLLLNPLFHVSHHVYDLQLMDNIKHGESDFYPAMLLREVVLWIGRVGALIILYILFILDILSLNGFLQVGLILIGLFFITIYGSAYLWKKKER